MISKKGFMGGPQGLRKAAPGPLNRGEGRLASLMRSRGTSPEPEGRTVGAQDPRMSPHAGGRTRLTGLPLAGRLRIKRRMR